MYLSRYGLRTEYDHGVSTYSPEGRLFQVEYAIESIKLGSTAIGIRTKEGVVLAVEKRLSSKLIVPSSVIKIMEIDHHIGAAMSGLVADAITLIDNARVNAANFYFNYGEPMSTESVAQSISEIMLSFGEDDDTKMSRPFGVALLIGGYTKKYGYQLFLTDSSGTYTEYKAVSIGAGCEGATDMLKDLYKPDLTLKEGIKIALSILKQVMKDKITCNNIDVATVTETGYKLFSDAEVEESLHLLD
ncbi:proteasome subunit alpha type 5 [Blastocystis sp. ATCC 50177/Nand II]|uniref:Proteasome subunit alpha type n=1 Tax=Blastocystis sp. subtype 1 (strain ATCC 50177 / NandII) TaxID=478820 RepID=A0A196SM22_BLAHN|nr:proteasome subunit alpha type 5 [Blastocystis sp. ATCC 50177/Nand II]